MTERTRNLNINHVTAGIIENFVIRLYDDGQRIYFKLISADSEKDLSYEKTLWADYKQRYSGFLASLITDELMKEPSVKSEIELIEKDGRIKELENELSDKSHDLDKYRRVCVILMAAGIVSEEKMEMAYKLAGKTP